VTWYYVRETGVSWTVLLPRRSDLVSYAALWGRFTHNLTIGSGIRGSARP
jgi:hypothetical protein